MLFSAACVASLPKMATSPARGFAVEEFARRAGDFGLVVVVALVRVDRGGRVADARLARAPDVHQLLIRHDEDLTARHRERRMCSTANWFGQTSVEIEMTHQAGSGFVGDVRRCGEGPDRRRADSL